VAQLRFSISASIILARRSWRARLLGTCKAGCGDANCLKILSTRINDLVADQWGRYRCPFVF
jgi:hypothetical protein